ncbi:MAG: DUF4349 domain-containing protein [Lachnospiraceae bacterium]|nr:DUF4349 domain-containing protein [Lachnospiraceae bacterium]
MNKNDLIFGKLLPALMLVTVLVTGCGGAAADMAERASEAAYDVASDLADMGSAKMAAPMAKASGGYAANDMAFEAEAEEAYYGEEYDDGGYEDGYDESDISTIGSTGDSPVLDADKIVYYADINLSSKHFDNARNQIDELAEKYGAILENENYNEGDIGWYTRGDENGSNRRYYYAEYRVPAENYKALLSEAYDLDAVVSNLNRSARNITRSYYDTKAEIESLETEMEQLEEIMKDARKIEDVLYIQERITEVRTQLNRCKSDISRMDTDVAYSYVNISLQEVKEYKEPEPPADLPFEQQLWQSFNNSIIEFYDFCDKAAIYIARNWIKILAWLVVILIILCIIRGGGARRYARRELKREYKEKKLEMKKRYKEMKQEMKQKKKEEKD